MVVMQKALFGSLSAIGITYIIWRISKRYKRNHLHRVELKIHSAEVGHLIGESGERLKDIIQKSGAKIKFRLDEKSYEYCLCIIEGDETKVLKAQRIIFGILKQYAVMDIDTCFIMKGGADNSFASLSDAFNESSQSEGGENQTDTLQHSLITDHTQKLDSSNNDGLIPVYVSAVASPDSFWVQSIKTKEHIELDRLTQELSEYYEANPESNVPPPYADVNIGYICATFSVDDNRWYRAEVARVSPLNETDVHETMLDLYFLDYGVSSYQKIKNIRRIPPKFLELKFQAIECSLSHIKPANDNIWSEESLSFFEDITHVGEWYTLMARIDGENDGYPQLTLIDTNSGADTNLADEMVNRGFATYLLN